MRLAIEIDSLLINSHEQSEISNQDSTMNKREQAKQNVMRISQRPNKKKKKLSKSIQKI